MARPKCILIKLLETPEKVRVRVIGDPRRKGVRHCVVIRDSSGVGWKKVYSSDEYELALAFLERTIKEL